MMLGSKGFLTPLIPDYSALCAPAILILFKYSRRVRLGKWGERRPSSLGEPGTDDIHIITEDIWDKNALSYREPL